MNTLTLHIEALIFASDSSIHLDDIQQTVQASLETEVTKEEILACINAITEKYADPNLAIALTQLNGGFQFLTKKEYHKSIGHLLHQRSKKKLTQAALETLAIIAYRQPVTKLEIEQIRGVNCDYTVQRLLEKELISIAGKAETPGKPILYGTSGSFMDYFGINSTAELPQIKDIISPSNEIGETDN